jgi:K+-transporting ATPase ATPase B chain
MNTFGWIQLLLYLLALVAITKPMGLYLVRFPAIAPLNIMRLDSPASAILSAVIFNALIIIALIPPALRGVAYKPVGALAILQRNLLIYGLGGIVIPFIGIKLIDLIITALHFV